MSDHGSDQGPDALTPFEFALAGVRPPGTDAVPSLRVVDDMRALLDDQQDVPVRKPELHDLLDATGWFSLGSHGRRPRPRGPLARRAVATRARGNGAFVDITPPDIAQVDKTSGMPTAPIPAGDSDRRDDGDPAADRVGVEPVVGAEVGPDESADAQRSIDSVQADLQVVLAQSEVVEVDIPTSLDDQLATGPIAAGPDQAPAAGGSGSPEVITPTPAGDEAAIDGVEGDQGDGDPADRTSDEQPDPVDRADHASDPAVMASTTDRLRVDDGRFAPATPPDEAGVAGPAAALADTADGAPDSGSGRGDGPSEADPEDEPVPAATVAAGGIGLFEPGEATGPPLVSTAARSIVTAPARRSGGAILALAGAGAAAAVLVAGSLWWANSTSTSSTEADRGASAPAGPLAEAGVAAGSLDGSSERSTGDDGEPAEFTDRGGSGRPRRPPRRTGPPSGPRWKTGRPRPRPRPPTAGRPRPPGRKPPSRPSGSRPRVGRPRHRRPSRRQRRRRRRPDRRRPGRGPPPRTRRPPVRRRPNRPDWSTSAIGSTVGDYDGPGLGGVQVALHADDDRDGRVDRQAASTVTGGQGRYSFDVPAGCYEVRFAAPSGYRVRSDHARQYLCLDPGEAAARTDALVDRVPDPPDGCLVEQAGRGPGLGVEVYERSENWADSYTFYTRSGSVVVRTRNLGPYDTDPGEPGDRSGSEPRTASTTAPCGRWRRSVAGSSPTASPASDSDPRPRPAAHGGVTMSMDEVSWIDRGDSGGVKLL